MNDSDHQPPLLPGAADQAWKCVACQYLVYDSSAFIVYLDKELDVWAKMSPAWKAAHAQCDCRFNEIMNNEAELESVPNRHQPYETRLTFKKMIGNAVACALQEDFGCAQSMLNKAREYIVKRNVEVARLWQLKTVLWLLLGPLLVVFVATGCRTCIEDLFGSTVLLLLLAGAVGGFGAFLSIIYKLGTSNPSSESPRILHVLEALARIIAGVMGGCLIAVAMKTGVVLSLLLKTESPTLALYLGAFVAGVSEKLVPSFVKHIEDEAEPPGGGPAHGTKTPPPRAADAARPEQHDATPPAPAGDKAAHGS